MMPTRQIFVSITEGRGSNFFLFADREALATANPFQIDWMTGKGEHVKLSD
jgi:hypothetical protein